MIDFAITRRGVVLGLAAASTLPRVALGQGTPRRGGTLKISHTTRIATLNVLQLSGPAEYPAVDMIYSGLTRMGADLRPMPDLAESWEGANEARSFTFRLRPGVTFHDGAPCEAEDVVATFKGILDPATASPARSVLSMIADVVAVDPLTVRFDLNISYADFPTSVGHANARIVPRAAWTRPIEELNTQPNGTGPFRVETYDSARLLRLVRNENYFIAGQPYLDAVEMYLFPDLAAEASNFLSGAVDVMLEVQQAEFARIAAAPGVSALRVPSGRFINVVMRQDQPPFDDVRVRKALAMAVDRQLLVDIVLEGLGRPAYDNPIAPEYRYQIETPEIPYDPAAARALLSEAGHPDGLKITLVASNRPAIRGQVAIAIKEMARAAGFEIEVESMPHDTYLSNVWMKGNFYMGYWGMQPTEDGAFTLLFTSDAAFQDTEWKNAEFDALVARGRSTLDEAERAQLYGQAQELILRDTPYLIPFFQDVLTAYREGVVGWGVHPLSRTFYVEQVWLDRA
ncbi:MAG: ABC transporter substrate-binding protein [Rhodobacteraceae bacterium]|jgi:peptide/nickel transport system substrate-binding protein|nr:ABC transporter substrate-binding protein [Paracoccaceae bacterium]